MRIVLTAVVVAAAIHAAAWSLTDRTASPADVENSDRLRFLQPVPAGRGSGDAPADHPGRADRGTTCASSPTVAQGVRTYSVIDGIDQVPAIAGKLGLNVVARRLGRRHARARQGGDRRGGAARQAAPQRPLVAGRQRGADARRAHARRNDRADPESEEAGPGAGVDRRNLVRVDGESEAGQRRRLHRGAHPAVLGRRRPRAGGELHARKGRSAAQDLSRQAHRRRRVRLAEPGLQSSGRGRRAG